ncbi:MAG: DUF87 domain-containing protein [Acidimicrobiales bacterium]
MAEIPKGSLFLGDKINAADHKRANELVMYEAANLTTHGVIVGMTGSGKTGLGIVLLEECLLQGIPALIIDPKGDMGNLLLAFPDQKPESFRPYVLESDAKKEGRTLDEHAAVVAKQWADGQAAWEMTADRIRALHDAANFTIYTPGSNTGIPLNIVGDMRRPGTDVDDEVLQDEIDGLVSSLLNLVDIESDPLSGREHILLSNLVANAWRNNADLDLAALVAQVQQPPMRKLGVIDLDTFFPEKDRLGLAMRLNGLIASPAFASWARGVPLDIDSLLYTDGKPNAAIIEIAHLSDQERQFVVTLVLSKLVTWMRQQSGTPDLRVIVYMDEVFGFVPPTAMPPAKKPILTIFKQARAFGVGMVLATQNPVDIDYKALANAGTWMIGRLQTERDKARLMEGLKDAAGATDMETIDSTISGLAKREFVLHSAKANKPLTFTSRWALSYLPGPLSREQITTLMADSPLRQQSAPRPTDAGSTTAPGAEPPAPMSAPAPALADDESSLAPTIADGVPVYYLDPAAAWGSEVNARSGSKRLEAAVVARVKLLFDDEKADVREQQEWEAVFFPLNGALDASEARHVDYDDRDFRSTPPDSAVYVLPDAELKSKTYFAKAKTELQDHLYRTMTVEVLKNSELKLFSRVGESKDDFATRCGQVADDLADKDADKLRKTMADKIDRIKDAIDKAEDKVREVHSDKKKRGLDAVVSAAGGILGSFLGGRKSTKSVLGTVTRTMGKERMREQAGERLETAKNRLEGQHDELADLEQELTDKLQAIQDDWDRKAAQVESLSIELEKTDITVDEIAVVWVPTE